MWEGDNSLIFISKKSSAPNPINTAPFDIGYSAGTKNSSTTPGIIYRVNQVATPATNAKIASKISGNKATIEVAIPWSDFNAESEAKVDGKIVMGIVICDTKDAATGTNGTKQAFQFDTNADKAGTTITMKAAVSDPSSASRANSSAKASSALTSSKTQSVKTESDITDISSEDTASDVSEPENSQPVVEEQSSKTSSEAPAGGDGEPSSPMVMVMVIIIIAAVVVVGGGVVFFLIKLRAKN